MDFDEWYKEGKETVRGMVGSGSLDWPPETDRRLALQLSLFRAFAADREGVSDFCTKFMYAGNHYDDMVAEVNDQLFRPMARDLRRLLARELEAAVTGGEEAGVPASDRYVRLDHNSPAYTQTVAALEAVVEAVRRDNEYGSADPDDRDQRIAELEAGKRLLQEVRVRVDAAHALFVGTLGYLAVKFADAAIGNMANEALNWVRVLLGF